MTIHQLRPHHCGANTPSNREFSAPYKLPIFTWAKRVQIRSALRRDLDGRPCSVLADAGFKNRNAFEAEMDKPFWRQLTPPALEKMV